MFASLKYCLRFQTFVIVFQGLNDATLIAILCIFLGIILLLAVGICFRICRKVLSPQLRRIVFRQNYEPCYTERLLPIESRKGYKMFKDNPGISVTEATQLHSFNPSSDLESNEPGTGPRSKKGVRNGNMLRI